MVFVAVYRSDGLRGDRETSKRCIQEEELPTHLDDVEELVPVDAAISVHVVEFEIPAQFVFHLSSHHQAESSNVLHEVYVAVLRKQEVPLDQMHV